VGDNLLRRSKVEKVKVKHRSTKSATLITRFGELTFDENGVVEVDKDTATKLCDINLYGGVFSRYFEPKAKVIKEESKKVEVIKEESKVEVAPIPEIVAPIIEPKVEKAPVEIKDIKSSKTNPFKGKSKKS
jgi:hypothetical protein